MAGPLLGIISDIRRVHTNLEDPVDVRNDPQKGIHAKAFSSSNLIVGFELLFFYLLSKPPLYPFLQFWAFVNL